MRTVASAVQTVLGALGFNVVQTPWTLLYFPTLSLRFTQYTRAHTWEGDTYTAKGFRTEGLGQNLKGDIPRASITFTDLDNVENVRFWADSFRGVTVHVVSILQDGVNSTGNIAWPDSSGASTWRVDDVGMDKNEVTLNLAVSDAQQRIPHVTTQESHCQHVYGPYAVEKGQATLCPYRGNRPKCDRTFDGSAGCKVHFFDIDENGNRWTENSTGARIVVPKPYGGLLGGLTDRLVRGG